jgi:uncharacterized protein YdeI (YjbR/CyaY-like superfamily)
VADKTKIFPEIYAEERIIWRDWLKRNHRTAAGVWLVYYKKHTGRATVSYNDAVEEALCFGWIDSKVNTIDDKRYKQVFTPRNPKSIWSALNKKRAEKMIRQRLMTNAGLKKIEAAKKDGSWNILDKVESLEIPVDLKNIFLKNKKAEKNYNSLKDSVKKNLLYQVESAKLLTTRNKRIKNIIVQLKY